MSGDERERTGGAQLLTIFACLWAAFIFFHLGSYRMFGRLRPEAIAAAGVLIRPDSTIGLATLAAVQLYETIRSLPSLTNHSLFAGFINAGLLAGVAAVMLRRRRLAVDRDELYAAFAPAARLAVIALYFFAVFHKLNTDWFDPQVSCASTFWDAQLRRLSFLPAAFHAVFPTAFHTASIYVALGLEALIPLLFLFPRTRHAGILVGAGFHGLLALNPTSTFYNFSSLILAVYVLFVSPGLLTAWPDRIVSRRIVRLSWLVAAALFSGAFATWVLPRGWLWRIDPFLILFILYCGSFIAALAWLLRRSPASAPLRLFALPEHILVLLPILVFMNGLMPYLGLKTENSWAMFSNLRTEGGVTNHWLIPARAQLFDYQQELVAVVSSSDGVLQSYAEKGQLVPYVELRRRPEAAVSYVRDGVEHSYQRIADDPAYPGPLPRWLAKLMLFRPVNESRRCGH